MYKVSIFIPEDKFSKILDEVSKILEKNLNEECKYINVEVSSIANKEFEELKKEWSEDEKETAPEGQVQKQLNLQLNQSDHEIIAKNVMEIICHGLEKTHTLLKHQ